MILALFFYLQPGVGQGQISQIIQNVLVQLLGGGGILGKFLMKYQILK